MTSLFSISIISRKVILRSLISRTLWGRGNEYLTPDICVNKFLRYNVKVIEY